MQAEFNRLQSDWLNQAEELNDNEAAQVNGGASPEEFAQQHSDLQTQITGLQAQAALSSASKAAIQAESETLKQSIRP